MNIRFRVKPLVAILPILLLSFVVANHAQSRSILIKSATIIDGTGRPQFNGDLRISGGKIVKIGQIKPAADDEVIDARGLILAP
ncbi:MAG: hypothetical protein ABJB40_14045, partial [Acidobacteriota bacterium]